VIVASKVANVPVATPALIVAPEVLPSCTVDE
jgi:hypothetical protein